MKCYFFVIPQGGLINEMLLFCHSSRRSYSWNVTFRHSL